MVIKDALKKKTDISTLPIAQTAMGTGSIDPNTQADRWPRWRRVAEGKKS